MVDMCQRNGVGDTDATLVLLFEGNVRGRFVNADTEALKFGLDDSFVGERFVDIQNNEY